jgi:hypothetical protein
MLDPIDVKCPFCGDPTTYDINSSRRTSCSNCGNTFIPDWDDVRKGKKARCKKQRRKDKWDKLSNFDKTSVQDFLDLDDEEMEDIEERVQKKIEQEGELNKEAKKAIEISRNSESPSAEDEEWIDRMTKFVMYGPGRD